MNSPESIYNQVYHKNPREILSNLADCYGNLDSQQQELKDLMRYNQQFRLKFQKDLSLLADLDIISPQDRHQKEIQYNLREEASDSQDIKSAQRNMEIDLEILKYRQARTDINHNQISIFSLAPEVVNRIIYDPNIHRDLLENMQDIMTYMWQYTKIQPKTLRQFEERHGLENIVQIDIKQTVTRSDDDRRSELNSESFRLTALHYVDDLKIDLDKISIFQISKDVAIMTCLTNKTFAMKLEGNLIKARLAGILDNQQLRVLQNYYNLTDGFDIEPTKYHSTLQRDLSLIRQFDWQNPEI